MDTLLYFLFTAAYMGLVIGGLRRQRSWNFMSFIYLVLLGLIYDNGMIALGKFIGEGPLLENLSLLRFWSHAFLTPALVLFSYGALQEARVEWSRKRIIGIAAIFYTAALIIAELLLETIGMELMIEKEYGVLRYVSADPASGPPIMVLLVSVVLLAAGAILWKRRGWKWMLVGAVVMTIGSAVPIPVESSAATNAFELFLLAALVSTKVHLERRHDT
ncbi:hypothetical protein BN1080_03171 [Planococcus massiliensis]|uniref:Phospholipid phosphatase n=1 Tax=Planococcus massiliensis TaxID=1499687 RepID=A0A098ES64_9BACL|nr:hypothetical protein [Planococcus massiliensis]CEG24151.1 hypothetical protein BN1080_03171 [Planococcus massiliensis]